MFGIIPFLNSSPSQIKNILFLNREEIKVSFFYFFVQVVGRLFFAWGRVLGGWFIIGIIGLIIKIGAAPFFWWVPPVVVRLDWFSIGIIRTIQKIPGIFLFRLVFDIKLEICLGLALLGFLVSAIGIKFSSKKLKQLIRWSSVRKMRILFILIVLKKSLGIQYYLFYRILVLLFCFLLNISSKNIICKNFIKGRQKKYNLLRRFLLLVFSGLPPFIRFLLKVYFLRGFYMFDLKRFIEALHKMGIVASLSYLIGYRLKRWSIIMILLFLIIVQSVGYIKAFIKMYSTGSSRLSLVSKENNLNYKMVTIYFLLVYLLSIVVILI